MKKSVLVVILIVMIQLTLLGMGCKFDADSIASTVFNEQNNNDQETSTEETSKGEEPAAEDMAEEEEAEKEDLEEEEEVAYNNDFGLEDMDGNMVYLSNFQGNMIVLNFWATWCGPCRAEIPDFVEVYNEYKNKGVVFVGVSLDNDINDLKQFIDEYNINYPILFDNKNVNDIWKVEAIPTTFILDRNGNELTKRVGSMIKQDLINLIENNR